MNRVSTAAVFWRSTRPPEWTVDAACRGLTPDAADRLFFTETGGPPPAEALSLCAGCPVTQQCADAGATERYGIWAGANVRSSGGSAAA